MCNKICLLTICLLVFSVNVHFVCGCPSSTQDSLDSEEKRNLLGRIIDYFENSNKVNNDKRFDISFVGGPHYSSDTKLGVGLVASGLYRIDRNDLSISPSNVSLYGNFTTSGAMALGIEGNTIFPKEKYRLDYNLFFLIYPGKYWGIGYDRGNDKHGYTKYTQNQMQIKVDFLKKILSDTYIGITATGQYVKGRKFDDIVFLEGEDKNNGAVGGGFIVAYDTRDFIPNPYKGLYVKLEQNIFPTFMGSSSSFNRTNITFRYYLRIWNNGILAFDTEGIFNNGNVPWSMLAQVGGSYRMRGYYRGQYRDKKLLQTQVELRQKIFRRNGAVIWAGAGNIFPSFSEFEWDQTLPNFGIGYRWEFKNRINVRLDYGIGKQQTGFYFNINEAF